MVQLRILTESEVEAVHQATLRILGEIGIALTQPEARDILVGAGARVRADRVLLPPELVEEAVARCPNRVAVRGRGGETAILGDGTLHWHNLGGARDVYEPATRKRRPAELLDVADSALLLDALEGCTTITPFFTPRDAPGPLMSLAMYRYTLPHTTKPVHGPGVQTAAEVGYALRMAAVIGPPAEVLTLGISPVSPLRSPSPKRGKKLVQITVDQFLSLIPQQMLGPLIDLQYSSSNIGDDYWIKGFTHNGVIELFIITKTLLDHTLVQRDFNGCLNLLLMKGLYDISKGFGTLGPADIRFVRKGR